MLEEQKIPSHLIDAQMVGVIEKKAKVVGTYDSNNTKEGRQKEQQKIDEHGLENLDNKRNEIKKDKKKDE